MFIDSHAHLDMEAFEGDLQETLDRALQGGIRQIISIGVDLSSSRKALELAHKYDFIYATTGYHPHNAAALSPDALEALASMVSDPKVVAWGEIGLDFFRRYSRPDTQRKAFVEQLEVARDLHLPVVIHDRDAHAELLQVLRETEAGEHKGVIHCFSGDLELAMTLIEMGYFIAIPGTVTYKNADTVQQVASRIPLERMLLETDAPFLAPLPKRGRRNEPLFLTYTASKIAQLRGIDVNDVARRTSENARDLFNLPENP